MSLSRHVNLGSLTIRADQVDAMQVYDWKPIGDEDAYLSVSVTLRSGVEKRVDVHAGNFRESTYEFFELWGFRGKLEWLVEQVDKTP